MKESSSVWIPINEMGLYKVYRRLPTCDHRFRWIGRAMTAEERFEADRKEKLLNRSINEMGIYAALKNYGKKWAYEQRQIRQMRGAGATIEQIALEMETSEKVIRCRLAGGWKV